MSGDGQVNQIEYELIGDIRRLIDEARQRTAVAVNSELTLLYYQIGQRIQSEILQGEQIVASLSRQLESDYGRGFAQKNLRHMLRFAEAFPDEAIVYALRRQLIWTHFRFLSAKDTE